MRSKEASRAYYLANKEKILERNRRWFSENRERHRELTKSWYAKNKEKKAAKQREWWLANSAANNEYIRKWRRESTKYQAIKARRRDTIDAWPVEQFSKQSVYDRDAGICYLCSQPVDPNNWHLDHVVPLSKGGDHAFDNCGTTHPGCNVKKGTKTPWELETIC